jgi:hypothetical protein
MIDTNIAKPDPEDMDKYSDEEENNVDNEDNDEDNVDNVDNEDNIDNEDNEEDEEYSDEYIEYSEDYEIEAITGVETIVGTSVGTTAGTRQEKSTDDSEDYMKLYSGQGTHMGSKRLMEELKILKPNHTQKFGYKVSIIGDNLYNWFSK